ncbi:DEAD/DEAH box helicase family protein [Chloracidobacterium sp. D]|nr:DEAD/DEAH box helicase family protein [Chloracidobacterium sp. D]
MRIYLQQMVEDIPDDLLPEAWADHDLAFFSHTKRLYDYQQQALCNALKALWKYYWGVESSLTPALSPLTKGGEGAGSGGIHTTRPLNQKFWQWYLDNGLSEDLSIEPKSTFADLLREYYAGYIDAQTGKIAKIAYEEFINRMGFWMATGSGKTLVIVKLIELLGRLRRLGEVPPCDILFLTHRNDLIEQLRRHVAEFNTSHSDTPIVLHELKDYAAVKREQSSLFQEQGITVFYYRSDNLSAQQKEKILDFCNYDNDGKWFVLLDEAHKGDREDSKRQHIYSILSRNGFLFNFSATFTDPRDIATTVYNFNLSEYIRRGYGKHLLVLQQELRAFKDKSEDYTGDEKRKLVLKMLMLLAYARKMREEKVVPAGNGLYHRPLMLVLVNSVNTQDADLELFFRELEQIARQRVDKTTWQSAKDELGQELKQSPAFLFEDERVKVDRSVWDGLSPEDIRCYVFNAGGGGEIEVLLRPSNRQEMAFKLKAADRPFALIKIGDISAWLKQKLSGYEIAERFDDESLFARLNEDDSDINILMGSRSFYEGWDSNRPNVLCYINIGTGADAQKFILQSVGRGVRIEPIKNKRKRLLPLYNAGEVEQNLFQRLKDAVQPLETLFIFGTNRTALQTVLENLQKERPKEQWRTLDVFKVNPEAEKACLLIPVYKPASAPRAQQNLIAKFEIARDELDALRAFVQGADDRVLLALTDAEPKQVKVLRGALQQNSLFTNNGRQYGDLRRLLRRVVDYLGITPEEVDRLKLLEDEIRHFKHITVSLEDISKEDISELETKVKRVKDYPTQVKEVRELYGKVSPEEYEQRSREISRVEEFTRDGKRITIKHIARHYYLPIVLSEDGKADYIRHIIKTESEVKFIKDLEAYLSQPNNEFQQFDWWFFSKLDESLDEVYIPYYDPKTNRIARFKPDFIFWLCKDKRYRIAFVDPKGTEHVDYRRKIDGYSGVFLQKGQLHPLMWNGKTVTVHLFFYTDNIAKVPTLDQQFWCDYVGALPERLLGQS